MKTYNKAERDYYKQVVDAVFVLGHLSADMSVNELTEIYGGGSDAGHLYSIMALASRYSNPCDDENAHEEARVKKAELIRIGEFLKTTLVHNLYDLE